MHSSIGVLVPITAILVLGLGKMFRGPLGAAFARRLEGQAVDGSVRHQFADLQTQLDDRRRELTETPERLDFAERLLARDSQPARLS